MSSSALIAALLLGGPLCFAQDAELASASAGRAFDGSRASTALSVYVGASSRTLTSPLPAARPGAPAPADPLYFGGFLKLEKPGDWNWARWLYRGMRRDSSSYFVAKGVNDDLAARALVIKGGGKKIGLVTVEVVGLLHADTTEIRRRVRDLGFDIVIVQATHTHAGPDTIGLWGPVSTRPLPVALVEKLMGELPFRMVDGKNPRFMERIYAESAAALREADANARAASLSFGSSRLPDFEGKPLIGDSREPEVFDPNVHVLQARDAAGRAFATVANLGVHPTAFGKDIDEISADLSGAIARAIEAKGGGAGFHANAALGAHIGPNRLHPITGTRDERIAARWRGIRTFGDVVGDATLASIRDGATPITDIGIRTRKVFIPVDNALFDKASREKIVTIARYTDGRPDLRGQDLMTELDLVVLHGPGGRPVAEIFTIPGEMAPELYLGGMLAPDKAENPAAPSLPALKDHLRAPYQYLLGLGNDELGYIVPLNDFKFPDSSDPLTPPTGRHGRRHYDETVSVGSQMAALINWNLIGMLEEYYDGRTAHDPATIRTRSRADALRAFAAQKDALGSIVGIYLNEPADAVTMRAADDLAARPRLDAIRALSAAPVSTDAQRRRKSELMRRLSGGFLE